ncbi:MAG: GTPase ObgE [bacterium]
MFIDHVRITVKAGNGGNGCVSFRREKYVPKGGPDGGDGGRGGDVILEVNEAQHSLSDLFYTPHIKAMSGGHGKGNNCYGKAGEDKIIKVSPGTVVFDDKKNLIVDLLHQGDRFIIAKGGKGGKGNTTFKSSTNRTPRKATLGKEGEAFALFLELKLIADVGFVGYPNAGKSTLLSKISNAHPKIADYPFTTLIPNVGVRKINDRKVTFADIPGIIEGAHNGKGLGLDFLRHIDRTGMIVFIIDANQDILNQYMNLQNELKEYNPDLLKKPSIVLLNKTDLLEGKKKFRSPIEEAILISALKEKGIEDFLNAVKEKLVDEKL